MRRRAVSGGKAPLRIAVSGYYGCGNVGDEAVLAGIRESFARRVGDRVELTVFSQRPEETTALHHLPAVDRMNMPLVRRTLRASDLLLSGGGSLLQDATSMKSLLYYLGIAQIAMRQGTPVMFYAQGLGPLRRPLSRLLVRMVANRAACVTFRDEASAHLLSSLGASRPPIAVTADPAFALSPAGDEAVDALCTREGLDGVQDTIGVALRPWGSDAEAHTESCARLVTALAQECGCRILLIPMHRYDDVPFAHAVRERAARTEAGAAGALSILHGDYPPDVLLGLCSRLRSIVALRLHALIFAVRAGTPPFALSYDPKVEGLMRGLGLEDSLAPWSGFDPVDVARRVASLHVDREKRSEALKIEAAQLEQLALHTVDYALDAAYGRLA